MYRFSAYEDSMQAEWDRLAMERGTVFHTTGFRRILLESFGYRCAYQAILDEADRICGLFPLIVGRDLGLVRAGVSLPFVNQLDLCAADEAVSRFALAEIPALKERLQLDRLEIRLKDQAAPTGWTDNQENVTFLLPLLADEEATLAQASPGCRNHVRKTYRNDWFAVSFDPDRLAEFYAVYVRRMKQLGSPAPDRSFFQRFFTCLPEHSFLLTVLDKKNNRIIGGMLLLTSPGDQTLYYPYGATLIEYNSQYLNNFMYWEAMRFGMRKQLGRIDLGRSQTGSGTYRYKSQWGASAAPLHYLRLDDKSGHAGGEQDRSVRETMGPLISLWKVLPDWVTDPVGKRVIKYLLP